MNKLNVKQFKKRFIRGLVEPDLFKLPVEDYEKKICKQFTINTFLFILKFHIILLATFSLVEKLYSLIIFLLLKEELFKCCSELNRTLE